MAFRPQALLPLDDCLYALQATIPRLTRSLLHLSSSATRLAACPVQRAAGPRQKFNAYPIGICTSISRRARPNRESSISLLPRIGSASAAFAELHERATPRLAADFLRRLIEHVPYRIHTVLTDNGFQIHPAARRLERRSHPADARHPSALRAHAFDLACRRPMTKSNG